MNSELRELLDALELEPTGDGRFTGHSARVATMPRVFGGQLLAQIVVAAARTVPDKTVKSSHTIFVRPAELDAPLSFAVEVMHSGRLYASTTVTVSQHDRLCARALVLLDTADEELAAHAAPAPLVDHPDGSSAKEPGPGRRAFGAAELYVVGDVDLNELAATGPPELYVWARFPGAPPDDDLNRALLAYASEPHFFGTALRPHAGLGQALAYERVIPAVITHTVHFHAAPSAGEWLLLDVSSPHLGRGRIYGYASVFNEAGDLVASVAQENQLRPMRPGPG
jgi:acyl-CoA thioesterase II